MKRLLLALCLLAAPLAAQPSRWSLATQVQPGFASTALGDTYYGTGSTSSASAFGRVAGNTTTTRKFWRQVGTGSASAAPAWDTLVSGDIPNLDAAKITSGALATARGGNPLTTKGDLPCWTTLLTRKAVGTTGYVLTADPTDACGFSWGLSAGGGTVTSITATAPLTGGTITTTGSIGCATMVASGGSHAAGCVGDPGASAGSTKFWREDATFAVPAGGGSGTVDGISTVTLVAGSGMTISDNTPGAGQITLTSSGGSGYAGTLWIGADPNFTVATGYERAATRIRLRANPLFDVTIADAKANPPTGWAWDNSSLVVAADENTTTANGLYISASVGSNYTTVPTSVPLIHRTTAYSEPQETFFVRLASAMTVSNYSDERFVIYAGSAFASAGFDASGQLGLTNGTYSSSAVSTTLTQRTNGVWLRVQRDADAVYASYNLANQSTPPTAWTFLGSCTLGLGDGAAYAGFYADRYNSSYATTFSVLYFDDQHVENPDGIAASGFPSTSPVLALVSGFDLGASGATVTNANVQAALAEITNPREWDTAAWTWSVSRGSSAPVSCGGGTYAAAASVTVGGTGRYLSVCGKAASDGTQPASVNATALRIPFTP